MRFMPSSLTSNSHRLLTALVDSRHKKVYKVKNCITDIDPEREKEEREKVVTLGTCNNLLPKDDCKFWWDFVLQAANQMIRANVLLNRKREKVNKKYTPTVDRRRQLSPGFLEDALDEVWFSYFIFKSFKVRKMRSSLRCHPPVWKMVCHQFDLLRRFYDYRITDQYIVSGLLFWYKSSVIISAPLIWQKYTSVYIMPASDLGSNVHFYRKMKQIIMILADLAAVLRKIWKWKLGQRNV